MSKRAHVGLLFCGIVMIAAGCDLDPKKTSEIADCRVIRCGKYHTGDARFSPDGLYLITASDIGVQVWEVKTWQCSRQLRLGEVKEDSGNGAHALGFSPDGRILAVFGRGRRITLFDYPTFKEKTSFAVDPKFSGSGRDYVSWEGTLSFSPDSTFLSVGLQSGTKIKEPGEIRVFQVGVVGPRAVRNNHPSIVTNCLFSQDGRSLITASAEVINVWDTASWKKRLSIKIWQTGIACSPDRGEFAYIDNLKLQVFDLKSNRVIRQSDEKIENRGGPAVAWSPDGQKIAVGYGGKAKVYNARSLTVIETLLQPEDLWINGLDFSPDSSRLAAVTNAGTASIWEVKPKQ